MRRPFVFLRCAAAGLVLPACGFVFGAEASEEEAMASLQAAFSRSVVPGEQAEQHRELLAKALQRVKRSHATQVDLAALAATATKAVEPLPAAAGDPAEVFRTTISEVLRTLDPQSRYLDPQGYTNQQSESTGAGF